METIDEFPTDARLRMVSNDGSASSVDANAAAAATGRLCAVHEFSDSERIVYFGNVATSHATLLSIRDKEGCEFKYAIIMFLYAIFLLPFFFVLFSFLFPIA